MSGSTLLMEADQLLRSLEGGASHAQRPVTASAAPSVRATSQTSELTSSHLYRTGYSRPAPMLNTHVSTGQFSTAVQPRSTEAESTEPSSRNDLVKDVRHFELMHQQLEEELRQHRRQTEERCRREREEAMSKVKLFFEELAEEISDEVAEAVEPELSAMADLVRTAEASTCLPTARRMCRALLSAFRRRARESSDLRKETQSLRSQLQLSEASHEQLKAAVEGGDVAQLQARVRLLEATNRQLVESLDAYTDSARTGDSSRLRNEVEMTKELLREQEKTTLELEQQLTEARLSIQELLSQNKTLKLQVEGVSRGPAFGASPHHRQMYVTPPSSQCDVEAAADRVVSKFGPSASGSLAERIRALARDNICAQLKASHNAMLHANAAQREEDLREQAEQLARKISILEKLNSDMAVQPLPFLMHKLDKASERIHSLEQSVQQLRTERSSLQQQLQSVLEEKQALKQDMASLMTNRTKLFQALAGQQPSLSLARALDHLQDRNDLESSAVASA